MSPARRTSVLVAVSAVLVTGVLLVVASTDGREVEGELVDGRPGDAHVPPEGAERGGDGGPGARGAPTPVPRPLAERRLHLSVERWPDGEPITGATVRVASGELVLLRGARPSLDGSLDVPVPDRVESLHVTASAEGYESGELLLDAVTDLGGEVVLALRPTRGWFGRVTNDFGDPVAGAQVVARRYWPPRPAYLEDSERGDVSITSVQAVAPAETGGRTNETGHYYVEPFDDTNVVDLVVSVVDEAMASERMHVPLPHPTQELPDLVTWAATPLAGRVVDADGYPMPGVEVHVDRGPGLDRYVEDVVFTDQDGRFTVGRVFSPQHLRADDGESWFLGGRSQGLQLAESDGWVRVEPGAPFVSLALDPGGAVAGTLLDAATSEPIGDGLARLTDARGDELVAGSTDATGSFLLALPPDRIGETVTLRLSAPGYQSWNRVTRVERRRDARVLPEYLSPGPGARRVSGSVRSGVWEDDGIPGATVRAFVSDRGGPEGMHVLDAGLPPEFELAWEGATDAAGRFGLVLEAEADQRLVLVSELAHPHGALLFSTWGPFPVDFATERGEIPLRQFTDVSSSPVGVEGLLPNRRYLVQQTTWNPWTGSSWSGNVTVPLGVTGRHVVRIATAPAGTSFFDVRLDRGPVSAPVASTGGWLDLATLEPFDLRIPPFHTVQGDIGWYGPADHPDLCLAFLGAAVPDWRSEWLGESDWCVRPSTDGAFRVQDMPPGEYTMMLYRPVGVEGVEVLAERSVQVDAELFHVDIWPQRPDDAAASYILER